MNFPRSSAAAPPHLRVFAVANRLFLEPLACLAVAGLMVVISGNAISRSVFDAPWQFALPVVTGLFMPVLVFAGIVGVTLHDRHVRMELLSDRLGPRQRVMCRVLGWLTAIAFLGPATYANATMAIRRRDDARLQEFVVPATIQFTIVAVSMVLLSMMIIAFILRPAITLEYMVRTRSVHELHRDEDPHSSEG